MNFEELIEYLSTRACKKNIKNYREELMDLKVSISGGVGNRNISHGRLKKEREIKATSMKPLSS